MIRMIPNKNLNPHYNYLSDAIDSSGKYEYKATDYHFVIDLKPREDRVEINGNEYKDPDSFSSKLYNDFSLLTNLEYIDDSYKYLKYNDKNFTTDYIGVSRRLARYDAHYSEEKIGKILETFRTIGGHLIFPSETKAIFDRHLTINQIRGQASKYGGVYDRIDLTLFAIQCYFEKNNYVYSEHMNVAINNESDWFNEYGSGKEGFKNYIDAFLLNDFVDNDYNVLSLVFNKSLLEIDDKIISFLESPFRFDIYVNNLLSKIKSRSNKICDIV